MADYNITRVALTDVKSSDVGLATVEDIDDGEVRDMDFMASSNLIFYEFIGSPGIIAYIQCLGYLGVHSDGQKLANRRFQFTAPLHMLAASGDFLAIAGQGRMRTTCRTRSELRDPRRKVSQ